MSRLHQVALSILTMILLCGCVAQPPLQPVQSPNDSREYRYLELDNEMKVLLIHDSNADKAAASLVVARGSNDDPVEHAGLAHFLEHMLFLGTEKYPEVDGYFDFIATHGGSANAYTAGDHTNYFFDIEPSQFSDALDRFADFFISPKLDAAYVEREKNAVNSEYQMQLRDDAWRGQAVRRTFLNPQHPASRFNIGSLETLQNADRDEVVAFLESNYSADEMTLVVLSRAALDDQELMIRERFNAVVNRDIGPATALPPLFAEGSLPGSLTYRPIKDLRRLTVSFPIPDIDPYYRTKPTEYIANLLGHEGTGSLHAVLKQRGWIESLGAGPNRSDDENSLFSVSIELTELGAQHVGDIQAMLFAYIDAIRERGLADWRYDEQAKVADIGFRFQEEASPMSTVTALSVGLHEFGPRDVLRASYLMTGYDESRIRDYLTYLRPENAFTEISGPDVVVDRTEKWFGVPYAINPPLSKGRVDASFEMPQPNPYLPRDLALAATGVRPDSPLLLKYPRAELWHAFDTSFGVPRAQVVLRVHLEDGLQTPDDIVAASLLTRVVLDQLNAKAYPAQIAGLQYQVSPASTGFNIAVRGYNDNLPVLFEDVIKSFTSSEIDPERLATHMAELEKDYLNFKNERPYTQAMAAIRNLLQSNQWPPSILAQALPGMTVQTLEAWRKARFATVGATLLVHGNMDADDAQALARTAQAHLDIETIEVKQPEPRVLGRSAQFEVDVEHNDAAYVLYLQGAEASISERAYLGLLAQILRPQYFTSLRTEQQLGYVVSVSPARIRNLPGLAFIIQSPVASAPELAAATTAFIDAQKQRFASLPVPELEQLKAGFITRLLEADPNLFQRTQRFLADLDLGIVSFDGREQIADAVSKITPQTLAAAFERLTAPESQNRLSIFAKGHRGETLDAGTPITSITEFKLASRKAGSRENQRSMAGAHSTSSR